VGRTSGSLTHGPPGMAEGVGVAAPEGVVDGLLAAVVIGAGCEETDEPGDVPVLGAGGRGVAAA
jgi:hypothetical protein